MLNIIAWGVIILAFIIIPIIKLRKNPIIIELDDRYYSLNDIRNATLKHLKMSGKACEIVDERILMVDGEKYLLTETTVNVGAPVQQVILKSI
ncbi:hypothetical protein [Clostridium sp. B9]|uniref:hypothetical protein n=1 Tax=Clostridium sp. B9 TaxID=3423224 RepID=UPI003D2EDD64